VISRDSHFSPLTCGSWVWFSVIIEHFENKMTKCWFVTRPKHKNCNTFQWKIQTRKDCESKLSSLFIYSEPDPRRNQSEINNMRAKYVQWDSVVPGNATSGPYRPEVRCPHILEASKFRSPGQENVIKMWEGFMQKKLSLFQWRESLKNRRNSLL